MWIYRFEAEKVYGYLNFDIKFNSDINFLVGGNGSGKTTALRLMNALLNPNIKDLIQTPFKKAKLVLHTNRGVKVILAEEHEGEIVFSLTDVKEKLIIPTFEGSENFITKDKDKIDSIIESISRENIDHPVVEEISKLPSPVFLGLDRRRESNDSETYDYVRRDYILNEIRKTSSRKFIRGSLGASLMETEYLVQSNYKRLRDMEERQSVRLRNEILLSAFEYNQEDIEILETDLTNWTTKPALLDREREIKEALNNIGVKDRRLSKAVDDFFVKINRLFEQVGNNKDKMLIEWLLNKAQIERMMKLVDTIDEHKSKLNDIFRSINDFLSTINEFYKDSGKRLEIDTVGRLIVRRPDNQICNIEALSSGERQLLVIFAHLHLSQRRSQSVFIIDEPELSLHLIWQEKFADMIFNIDSGGQFILATHSPEIIGNYKDKAISCR